MNQRILAATAVTALAAVALAACGTGPTATPQPEPTGPITISYTNFTSNGGNEKNLTKIVDAFEGANPNVTVEVTTLPYADYATALQTDLAGGTVSDVFDIEAANYAGYQASGVLAPLTGVDTAVYAPSLAQTYATDGTQFALPSSFSNVVLFYNADLFDAAGLDYPTADWTWAEERAAAEKLTDAEAGVWGDYQPISYNEFTKAIAQAGGRFLTEDGTGVAFNSPQGIAAANWLIGKSGTTMPTAEQGAGTADFDSGLFSDGKLAMWHTGIWMFSSLAKADFAWDVTVEPGDTQKASALFSNAVAVSAGSEQQATATKFAQFLTSSTTTIDVRLEAGWELPPVADQALLAPYLDKRPPANRKAVFDSLQAVAPAPSIGDNQTELQDIVTEELTEAAAGRKTVEQALAAAEQRVTPLLG